MSSKREPYKIDGREMVAKAEGLRVQVLTVGPGQCVPWHLHTRITDTFFCLEGPMEVRTRDPDEVHVLEAGGRLTVPPNCAHRVSGQNDGPCKFAIVQGVGKYDYIPVD